MGRRSEHTQEQQREMALAAGELLLLREGIGGFSMRKVAQAIGYTVGNLYLLFDNQDGLFASINDRTSDAIYTFLRDASQAESRPADKLRAIAVAYIEFAQRHPNRWRLLFEHQLQAGAGPRESGDVRIARLFELVETCLQPLVPRATPRALRSYAAGLWSSVHGVCTLAITGKLHWSGTSNYKPLCELVVTTFLEGLSRSTSHGQNRTQSRRAGRRARNA